MGMRVGGGGLGNSTNFTIHCNREKFTFYSPKLMNTGPLVCIKFNKNNICCDKHHLRKCLDTSKYSLRYTNENQSQSRDDERTEITL